MSSLQTAFESLFWAASQVIPDLGQMQRQKREDINDAVGAMRTALGKTRKFMQKEDFRVNEDGQMAVSNVWNEASTKVGIVSPRLGRILGEKSRFWQDPEIFLEHGREGEILSLPDVTAKIDSFYERLDSRWVW